MVVFFAGNERYKALFQRYVGPSVRLSSTLTDADVVIALPNGCVNAWKSEDGKTLVDLSLLPSAGLDELRGFVEGVLPESDDSFSFFSPSSVRIVVEEGAGSILSAVFPSFSISVVPDVEEHRRRYVLSSIAMAFTFLFSLPLDALVHSPAFPRLFRMVSLERCFRCLMMRGFPILSWEVLSPIPGSRLCGKELPSAVRMAWISFLQLVADQ